MNDRQPRTTRAEIMAKVAASEELMDIQAIIEEVFYHVGQAIMKGACLVPKIKHAQRSIRGMNDEQLRLL